ncbi:hypothetical protein N0V83_003828 [Neocucurbitaria cava]|uniref:Major facilitator superfamily (MFS) profile domain-containing protein n=1 Tax=Neocucurbitaria cava TaxID=798079 RepID=A0A9W9CNP3_9PLEO|nr:hypothetical protein N0V83_003828 [Neocucurbitaria cava]
MVGLFSYYVNIGSIIGSVIDNYTKDRLSRLSYQIPLASMFIVPTLLAVSLCFVPESPRWLLHHDKTDEARASLVKLRSHSGDELELELEWAEMVRGVTEEKQVAQSATFMDLYKGHDLRRTLLCYGTIAAQTASGVWFFIGYQTYFLALAGITKAFQYTIMITCLGFVGVHVGLFSLKKLCGRRTVLIVVMFCYNAGVGAASSPVATELVSSRLRAWTVGSANALGYFLAWLVGFCSPYFINPQDLNWGARYSYIWAASNFICIIWFYFFIPETKARSLEELDEIFEASVAARKFKQYKCRIVEDAQRDVLGKEEIELTKQDNRHMNEISG